VPFEQLRGGFASGLLVAVIVIALLLCANFQSLRLTVAVLSTLPAVIAGVVLALFLTGTTLNIQSAMGAIMAVGVAVANAILLVTFADRFRIGNGGDRAQAAVEGGTSRLLPNLMTSCAMIAGMMPLALGLGEGGEQTAPSAGRSRAAWRWRPLPRSSCFRRSTPCWLPAKSPPPPSIPTTQRAPVSKP